MNVQDAAIQILKEATVNAFLDYCSSLELPSKVGMLQGSIALILFWMKVP